VHKTIVTGRSWEGSADQDELEYLASIARRPRIKLIGEIGFNAGLSSYTFLEANPEAIVYSFDLGEHHYVRAAKEHIDDEFPGRHHLILGDSLKTVQEFHRQHPGLRFDLIFVDGGHAYDVAKGDLMNMRRLAAPRAWLLTDDLTPWKRWGKGPTRAWLEATRNGVVEQLELYRDGERVDKIEPPGDRSWVLGRYL
jgi:predicted O-methyltransferase YrrM